MGRGSRDGAAKQGSSPFTQHRRGAPDETPPYCSGAGALVIAWPERGRKENLGYLTGLHSFPSQLQHGA